MQLLILTVWLLTTILICDAVQLTNNGNDFCIGFMRSVLNEPVRILIGTQSNLSIVFHFEYPLGSVIRTTTKNAPYQVNLFGEDVVNAVTAETSEYDDRNKGICITSTDGTDVLFVLAYITLNDQASASYLALPYQEILTNEYEYYALSTSSSNDEYYSGLLLVGFRDNTTVVIYPSIALNIPHDIQDRNSISKLIHPGENHSITLHRGQTLFIGKDQGDDVTGTKIVSDKPLTVISGHQAGSVPSGGTAEPMAQQILPTQLWGKRFLIISFAGHDKGQYIKVLTSKDNTQVTYTCDVYYNSVHIQNAGNVHQFFVSSDTYCYLEANNSVLVGQFAASPKGNTDGDTTMVLVASLDQYSNSFFFSTLKPSGLTHYISISVSSEYMYFDPDSILYDDISIETEWTAIYDNENGIIGYGCAFEVLQGLHTVAHLDCIGCLFVIVYGSTLGRAYSYPAGLTLSSKNVLDFSFSSDSYTITEAENNLSFEVKSLGTHNVDVVFKYSTKMMSYTTNGLDYDFVTDQVIIVSANDDSFTINVTIHDDELSEADEQFGIEVCTDFETNNICFMTVVTIIDNDVSQSVCDFTATPSSNTINLTWTEPDQIPSNGYTATYQCHRLCEVSLDSSVEKTSSSSPLVFTDVNPGSNCTLSLTGIYGINIYALASGFTITLSTAPTSPPGNIIFLAVQTTSMVVSWDEVPCSGQNGPITGYLLYYTSTTFADTINITGGENRLYTLTELIPYTNYTVQVSAYNDVGTGPTSDSRTQRTEQATAELFQLRIGRTNDCAKWSLDELNLIHTDIKTAIVDTITRQCNCHFNESAIIEDEFTCRYSNSYFTYRVKIAVNSHTFPLSAEQYVILIRNWVESGRASFLSARRRLWVDENCDIGIKSFTDPECRPGNIRS